MITLPVPVNFNFDLFAAQLRTLSGIATLGVAQGGENLQIMISNVQANRDLALYTLAHHARFKLSLSADKTGAAVGETVTVTAQILEIEPSADASVDFTIDGERVQMTTLDSGGAAILELEAQEPGYYEIGVFNWSGVSVTVEVV